MSEKPKPAALPPDVAAQIGPTGRFPGGRLDDDDKGELKLAVGWNEKTRIVEIHFGGSVTWLGMPAQDAAALAVTLLNKARESGEPIVIDAGDIFRRRRPSHVDPMSDPPEDTPGRPEDTPGRG